MRRVAMSEAENPLSAIARRVARVRADSGLNQGEFAERIGFPKRTYLGWERAETEPPIWLLTALRREFGIDPDWVLNGPDDAPRRHAAELDWERLQRLQETIREMAIQLGLEPSGRQLLDLARAVLEEPPEAEGVALRRMQQTLKAVLNGRA